ncbi:hypothetical protein F2Q68_00044983 [Brassica cretica]|uniref:Uncharacterized protein n=1 Tax=Brassica cretica TaxID=69181 RepID=A0A8S9LHQ7_BRACR|nr:hypothetical protein F2Q68_00044983 [Brassica cretica]
MLSPSFQYPIKCGFCILQENVVDNKQDLGCGCRLDSHHPALKAKPMKSTLQAKPKKKTMEGDSTGVVLLAFLIVKQRDFVINVPHRAFGIIFKICDQNRITKPMKSTLQAKPKKKTMEGDSTGVVLLAFLIVKQRDFVINVPHRSTEEDSNMANEPSRTRDCHLTLLSSHPSLDVDSYGSIPFTTLLRKPYAESIFPVSNQVWLLHSSGERRGQQAGSWLWVQIRFSPSCS